MSELVWHPVSENPRDDGDYLGAFWNGSGYDYGVAYYSYWYDMANKGHKCGGSWMRSHGAVLPGKMRYWAYIYSPPYPKREDNSEALAESLGHLAGEVTAADSRIDALCVHVDHLLQDMKSLLDWRDEVRGIKIK